LSQVIGFTTIEAFKFTCKPSS